MFLFDAGKRAMQQPIRHSHSPVWPLHPSLVREHGRRLALCTVLAEHPGTHQFHHYMHQNSHHLKSTLPLTTSFSLFLWSWLVWFSWKPTFFCVQTFFLRSYSTIFWRKCNSGMLETHFSPMHDKKWCFPTKYGSDLIDGWAKLAQRLLACLLQWEHNLETHVCEFYHRGDLLLLMKKKRSDRKPVQCIHGPPSNCWDIQNVPWHRLVFLLPLVFRYMILTRSRT